MKEVEEEKESDTSVIAKMKDHGLKGLEAVNSLFNKNEEPEIKETPRFD